LIGAIPWIVIHENQLSQSNKLVHGGLHVEKINNKWNLAFVGSNNL